jgi:membrane dipeptidase
MMAPTETQLRDARALLSRAPVFDGHNDLPWALYKLDGRGHTDISSRSSLVGRTHTDIARLVDGGVGAQFWSVYVPSRLPEDEALGLTVRQAVRVHRMVEDNPDHFALATTAAECVAAREAGLIASLLGAEGGHCIACSLPALRALHCLGVRYVTLTHNDSTSWADSATGEPIAGGLSPFGREVVAEMNRIGMIVDLSHTAVSTMNAAMEVATRPVLFSHSSARALVEHPRNVPDDVLVRMAAAGGMCQVTFVPSFVSTQYKAWADEATAAMTTSTAAVADAGADADYEARARFFATYDRDHPRPRVTIADVADHVDHVREVAGVDHVGLGGDYDGVDVMPEGLEDVSCYPRLIAELLRRGWSATDLAKLTWSNVLRVVRDCCG